MATRFEVQKFDEQSASFSLWRIKMKALLVQQGTSKALLGVLKKSAAMQDSVFKDLNAKALSSIQLCLVDDVLREVGEEDSVASIWLKLESIYMTKSLTNWLYLKQRLYTFHMKKDPNGEESNIIERANCICHTTSGRLKTKERGTCQAICGNKSTN